jgi:uncharacterized protein (TIRG00374 family)
MQSKAIRILNLTFLLLGLALLIAMIVGLDTSKVFKSMLEVGIYFVPAALVHFLCLHASAIAWWYIINPDASKAKYQQVFRSHWAGSSINALTPGNSAGELFKGTILRGSVLVEESISSLVLVSFLGSATGQLFVFLVIVTGLFFTAYPTWLLGTLFGVTIILTLPNILLYVLMRLGLAKSLISLVQKIRIIKVKNVSSIKEKAQNIDRRIQNLRRDRPRSFYLSVLFFFVLRLIQTSELTLILTPLMPDKSVVQLFILAALSVSCAQLIMWVVIFIPGQIGVAEGGMAMLFGALSLEPTIGLSLGLARRMIKLLDITGGVGVGLFAVWRSNRDNACIATCQEKQILKYSPGDRRMPIEYN